MHRAQQPRKLASGHSVRLDPGEVGTEVQVVVAQREARVAGGHGTEAADPIAQDAGAGVAVARREHRGQHPEQVVVPVARARRHGGMVILEEAPDSAQ